MIKGDRIICDLCGNEEDVRFVEIGMPDAPRKVYSLCANCRAMLEKILGW